MNVQRASANDIVRPKKSTQDCQDTATHLEGLLEAAIELHAGERHDDQVMSILVVAENMANELAGALDSVNQS
ncbi:hypothetical protein Q5Y75_07845 [Ruegeria sp. 2205SS24-7]|uniref:hypothetical protein n=1 Tax=Ruegeria discodermiae TaxID=3064389 RepID=UPI002740C3E7|nr:hypothetical protein [Ruegeria sp. 2205SS24-7]MDP5217125.1 hypothetical protein [Ruegeria sp. 2205SS24-7]